jgi:hypothetical protein
MFLYLMLSNLCYLICTNKNIVLIQVPNSGAEWTRIIQEYYKEYYTLRNFPICCGSMDGKHVIIFCPPKSGTDYYNYKNTFSIILFAIVHVKYNFLYKSMWPQMTGLMMHQCFLNHRSIKHWRETC